MFIIYIYYIYYSLVAIAVVNSTLVGMFLHTLASHSYRLLTSTTLALADPVMTSYDLPSRSAQSLCVPCASYQLAFHLCGA